jgi:Leucine-rich repeat (LRR) protein
MKPFATIVIFLSAVVSGHCVLKEAEVQEGCPVKCTCGVIEEEKIIADCSKQNYTSIRPHFPKLNSLYFSHNQISELRNGDFIHENFRNIQSIDLSNNKIRNIEVKAFEPLTQLRYLNLSSNEIRSITPESFKKLKKLEILDLRGNSIHCVALKNDLPWVNVLCNSSEEYVYDKIQKLCPPKCTCEVKAKYRIIANCSKQNYTSIPPHFTELYSLNFSHIHISEVRNVNFMHENLRHIQNIDLSNNVIQNIETKILNF